jgi:hypothetical protein
MLSDKKIKNLKIVQNAVHYRGMIHLQSKIGETTDLGKRITMYKSTLFQKSMYWRFKRVSSERIKWFFHNNKKIIFVANRITH